MTLRGKQLNSFSYPNLNFGDGRLEGENGGMVNVVWPKHIFDSGRELEAVTYDNCYSASLPRAATTLGMMSHKDDSMWPRPLPPPVYTMPQQTDASLERGFPSPFAMEIVPASTTTTAVVFHDPHTSVKMAMSPESSPKSPTVEKLPKHSRKNARRGSAGNSSTSSGSINNNTMHIYSSHEASPVQGAVHGNWFDKSHQLSTAAVEQIDGWVAVEWNGNAAGYHPVMGYKTGPSQSPLSHMCRLPMNDYPPLAAVHTGGDPYGIQNNSAYYSQHFADCRCQMSLTPTATATQRVKEDPREVQSAQRKPGRKPKRTRKGNHIQAANECIETSSSVKNSGNCTGDGSPGQKSQSAKQQEAPSRGGFARHESGGRTTFADIVHADLVRTGRMKLAVGHDPNVTVTIKPEGSIMYKGTEHNSVSSFALAVIRERNPDRRSCDGWKDVKYEGQRLEILRERYLVSLQQKN